MDERDAFERIGQAMVTLSAMQATYQGKLRLFCPHALGWTKGVLHCFAYQFDGESEHGDIPNWRCFLLSDLEDLEPHPGPWRKGAVTAHGIPTCLQELAASVMPEHTAASFEGIPERAL